MAVENCPWDGYGGSRWDCVPDPAELETIDWNNLPFLGAEQPLVAQEPAEEEQ